MESTRPHPFDGCKYVTPREYYTAARISRATFWRMVKRKQIEVVRFGDRCTRVPVRQSKAAA